MSSFYRNTFSKFLFIIHQSIVIKVEVMIKTFLFILISSLNNDALDCLASILHNFA